MGASSALAQVRAVDGRVRFNDRFKRNSPEARPSGSRWTAYLSVFGHDTAGEGPTQPAALKAAIAELPVHIRRHFTSTHGDTVRPAAPLPEDLKSILGTLAHNRQFTVSELAEYTGDAESIIRKLIARGWIAKTSKRGYYFPTKAGWAWIEGASGDRKRTTRRFTRGR